MAGWRTAGRFDRHDVSVDAAPVWVDADGARIEQVLANLVGNALKYTPPGGRVGVRAGPDGQWALLEVTDTGAGIPAKLIDRVFDPFVQGERALDRSQGGLGLGLALVKSLVGMHDGSVRASSPGAGKGATFTVRLPRVPAAARPPQLAAPVPPARLRVLVIEDNEDAREMLELVLAQVGHEVHAAPDGPRGVELASAVAPDVALVDVGLPGLDGYEVARRIRAQAGNGVRLIAITGYGQAEDRRRAEDAGFDAYLTKPVAPDRLLEVIAAQPGRRPARPGESAGHP
jgi:CheY-like chemotaxis protein